LLYNLFVGIKKGLLLIWRVFIGVHAGQFWAYSLDKKQDAPPTCRKCARDYLGQLFGWLTWPLK